MWNSKEKVLHNLSRNKAGMENIAIKLNCQNIMPALKPIMHFIPLAPLSMCIYHWGRMGGGDFSMERTVVRNGKKNRKEIQRTLFLFAKYHVTKTPIPDTLKLIGK